MPSVGMRMTALLAALATAAVVSSCGKLPPAADAQSSRDLILLANHISVDQQAQIETWRDLLGQWGEGVTPDAGHDGHGGMAMDGMVDAATMDQLQSLTGTPF